MQFKDQIDFVRQHIQKNKMRVFMTVLAATMGTAFLIVLASVGFGLHETIRDSILSNQKVTELEVYSEEMNQEKVDELKRRDHVKAVVYRQFVSTEQQVKLDDLIGSNGMTVTDFVEEGKANFSLAEGRLPKNATEVVVGSHFGQYLMTEEEMEGDQEVKGYKGDLIGKHVSYQLQDFEGNPIGQELQLMIVGVGTEPSKDWDIDRNVYGDASIIPVLESIYFVEVEQDKEEQPLFYGNVSVHADRLENVKALSNGLKEEGYSVYSIADELEQLDVFFLALKAGLVFVGTIAILIASIGIFNTMTMAVTERTREIGVMKAIGADPKLIQRLFLMESAWIGVIGTVLAVVISYGVSAVSNYVLPIIVSAALGEENLGGMDVTFSIIPWQLVLIASTISIGVAMISGWRPARKATKVDVIQALRQEL